MKKVILSDNPAGNAKGWNPNDLARAFVISEPAISLDLDNTFFIVEVLPGDVCNVLSHLAATENNYKSYIVEFYISM